MNGHEAEDLIHIHGQAFIDGFNDRIEGHDAECLGDPDADLAYDFGWNAAEPHVKTYSIVTFCFDENDPRQRTVPSPALTGLSLANAKAHCDSDATKGDGWFDGYVEEPNTFPLRKE